jgi:hypothetical protein
MSGELRREKDKRKLRMLVGKLSGMLEPQK